jgi:Zn ribbon nucleic-acid-binding protein
MSSKYASQLEKLGFRKWYEKRLTHAHGYLLLCILGMIMVAALAEGVSIRGPAKELVADAALLLASGGIATFAWVKYQAHMLLADELAHYATCARCKAYGKLKFLAVNGEHVRLECKKCGHGWQVDTRMFSTDSKSK